MDGVDFALRMYQVCQLSNEVHTVHTWKHGAGVYQHVTPVIHSIQYLT